jgi:hypothetical protein
LFAIRSPQFEHTPRVGTICDGEHNHIEELTLPRLGIIAALCLAFFATAPALAQTSVQPTPAERTKVLLDNDRVRVTELRLPPGAKFELPSEANQFAYLLTDATLEFARPGHTPYEFQFKAGEATLLPAQSTHAQNRGEAEVRAVLVVVKEVKRAKPAGKPRSGRRKRR